MAPCYLVSMAADVFTSSSERTRLVRGAHPYVFGLSGPRLLQGARAAALLTLDSMAWAIGDTRRTRRLKRLLARAGEPRSIRHATEGVVRVEGRVRALAAAEGSGVLAYHRQRVSEQRCTCGASCRALVRSTATSRALGRFVMREDDDLAIVEPGPFELFDWRGRAPDPASDASFEIHDGDLITVVGQGRREHVESLRSPGGYRGTKLPLVFRGTPKTPVYLFVEPERRASP